MGLTYTEETEMDKTILIVEDEPILREVLKDFFLNESYQVFEAEDGREALTLFTSHHIDLVVLDIMLPKLDGWSVCQTIRDQSEVPIIMLTARSEEEDTLLGFELGADDYVTKPYSPPILLARAKRLLQSRQRNQGIQNNQTMLIHGILVDEVTRSVKVDGQKIDLTYTEFEILAYLMRNKGVVITREQLITKIWGYEYVGDDRTINTHIRNLRIKLGRKSTCIKTMIRIGYTFEVPYEK